MLCRFAQEFPPLVARFLEQGRALRRRFREETVTDLMMGCMLTAGFGSVRVDFPNEPVTGADMQWDFVNRSSGTFFRILVQAKQAYGDGARWRRHSYRELFHVTSSSKLLQLDVLCRHARSMGAYPLYAFYHSALTCSLAAADGQRTAGINLASAHEVRKLTLPSARTSRRKQNVGMLSPLLFSLPDLFCPDTLIPLPVMGYAPTEAGRPVLLVGRVLGVPQPPTPEAVRSRLLAIAEAKASDTMRQSIPEITSIPDDVARLVDRDAREPVTDRLRRWRLTFVSREVEPDDRRRLVDR